MKVFNNIYSFKIIIFLLIVILLFSFSGEWNIQENKSGFLSKIIETRSFGQVKAPKPAKDPVKDAKSAKDAKEDDQKEKYFTLNFKDVEISEFLNMMSQLIGKNIILDEKVRGKITITSVKKFPVSHAYQILMSILEIKGLAAIETPSLIKIIPIRDAIKKNAEIVIDGKKQEIKTDDERTVTYILNIKFADANEIANALRSLKSNNVDVVVYPALNVVILSGVYSEIDGLIKISQELDRDIKEKEEEDKVIRGNIHVVHLENADAEQLAGVLSRIPFSENAKISQAPVSPSVPQQQPTRPSARAARTTRNQITPTSAQQTGKLSIIANKETNSLIIYATPDEFKEIYRIIKELDLVRDQVLIEALIVEISADKAWSLGIDWMIGGTSGGNSFAGSSITGTPNFSANKDSLPSGKTSPLPLTQGLQLGFLSGNSALSFALLSLSETDRNFNILSTPHLLTIDNHEAELNIGQEVPVTTNTRVTDQNAVISSFEYKSVGLKLKITPHITKFERITLDIYQEANNVITTAESTTLPTLTKRDIQTKVTVYDGKTIVIGGLIRNDKTVEETKVPLLGDIPILGWLFKRKSVSYTKSNLLVFITPYIVTKTERIDAITEQKQEEMKRSRIK